MQSTDTAQTAQTDPNSGPRLQAVPFWIVERSREIAEREKNESERAEGGLGRGGKKGKGKESASLSFISPRSSLAAL